MTSEPRPDFGDVTAEYQAARAGTGFASGTLGVVWVSGPDAVSFLDGQLSQDLSAMATGTVARALLLEPRGKLIAPLWVGRGKDRMVLVMDRGVVESAITRLESFMFRVEVAITVDDRPVHELWGRDSVSVATGAGLDPGDGWADIGEHVVLALWGGPVDRVVVVGPEAVLLNANAIRIGTVARTSVRIEAGEPVMGVDVSTSTIPQESGLVPQAVSFTKGCYVGQELVARIDSRGRVNQRLAGVVIGTNVVPPVGSGIVFGGEERGTVTSVGESLTLRAPVAMGMVHREVGDGATVELTWEGGSAPAEVRALPLDDFSVPSHSPLTSGAEPGTDVTGARP